MPLIDTAAHLEALASLANDHSTERVELLLVADCGEWAQSKGVQLPSRSPRAMALRRRPDGTPVVVMRAHYEQMDLEEQSSALLAAGWKDQAAEVKDIGSFLRFLVLHELGHLVNNWGQEREQEVNEWAFRRLGWSDA